MNDTSGPTLPTPLAFLDPNGSCWRMSQATLISVDQPLLPALPAWGTATSDGELYQLAQPERLINGDDGFVLLPTPTARDWKDSGPNTNYERQAKKRILPGVVMYELYGGGNISSDEMPRPL